MKITADFVHFAYQKLMLVFVVLALLDVGVETYRVDRSTRLEAQGKEDENLR